MTKTTKMVMMILMTTATIIIIIIYIAQLDTNDILTAVMRISTRNNSTVLS